MRSRWSAQSAGRRVSCENACPLPQRYILPPLTKNPGYVAVSRPILVSIYSHFDKGLAQVHYKPTPMRDSKQIPSFSHFLFG